MADVEAIEAAEVQVVVAPFDYGQIDSDTAAALRGLGHEIRTDIAVIAHRTLRMGMRLIAARRLVPRGLWGSWSQAEVPGLSEDSIQNIIKRARVAELDPRVLELEEFFDATVLAKLGRVSTPPAAIAEAVRRAEAGERVLSQAADEIIRAAKAIEGAEAAAAPEKAAPVVTVRLTAEGGRSFDVPAILYTDALALHAVPQEVQGSGFRITHRSSGLLIGQDIPLQEDAEQVFHQIAELDGWDQVQGAFS